MSLTEGRREAGLPHAEGLVVTKKNFWILFKYGAGIGLLAFVVWRFWSYPAPAADPEVVAATTVGMGASPLGTGPLAASASHVAGHAEKTLGLVNAVGKPINVGPLLLALF